MVVGVWPMVGLLCGFLSSSIISTILEQPIILSIMQWRKAWCLSRDTVENVKELVHTRSV